VSHKPSPDTSDAMKRILFSGDRNGPLPGETEQVNQVYDSDHTDLKIYDYTSISSLRQGYNPHYTLSFEESDYILKISGNSLGKIEEVVEILEESGPRELHSRFESAGPFGRFSQQVEGFQFGYEEYLEDFKEILEKDILD